MGPPLERYETPASVESALALLHLHRERAGLVAGGTDLLLALRRGRRPGVDVLVDVTRIPGLAEIREAADGSLHLGPLVTHAQVVRSALLGAKALPLVQACAEVGSPQIRNRGTVAGSVATGARGSDTLTALTALNASAIVSSSRGERTVRIEDLHRESGATSLLPDEMLVDVVLPAGTPGQRGLFVKLRGRQGQAFPLANLAIVLARSDDDTVTGAHLVLGGCGPAPVAARRAAACLVGSRLDEAVIGEGARLAGEAAAASDDRHPGVEHRTRMIAVMTQRGLRALQRSAERSEWPTRPVSLWGRVPDGRWPSGSSYEASHDVQTPIAAIVNGQPVRAPGAADRTLLSWLREEAGITGTKAGCDDGVCGACTVELDGLAVLACLVPAARAHGARIRTVEGLAPNGALHPLQEAFVACGAVQCGFCTPGFLMAGANLLEEIPDPTEAEIEAAYAGNLCRCTGYHAITRAVRDAADSVENARAHGDREA